MNLVRHSSGDDLAGDVAERFCDLLAAIQAQGRTPQVALTGGTIANNIYVQVSILAAGSQCNVDWSNVEFWWGDERFVAPESPDRNALQACDAFLNALPVDDRRVHPMPSTAEADDVDQAALSYSELVRAHGSGMFDLVLLGMGPDGHVASLFPGFGQLEVSDEIAVGVTGAPKPPPERVTLTLSALNRSERVWFVVSGEEKHEVAARARSGDSTVPASRVKGLSETIWFLA